MAQSKHRFYRKGPDNQKKADVTIDLRRIDAADILTWTAEEKKNLKKFIENTDTIWQLFKSEIINIAQLK